MKIEFEGTEQEQNANVICVVAVMNDGTVSINTIKNRWGPVKGTTYPDLDSAIYTIRVLSTSLVNEDSTRKE